MSTTVAAASKLNTSAAIIVLAIANVQLGETRVRQWKEGGAELSERIVQLKAQGQLKPIWVLENDDGTYNVLDGEGRYTALKAIAASKTLIPNQNHIGEINAQVVGRSADFSPADILEIQVGANFSVETPKRNIIDAIVIAIQEGKYPNIAEAAKGFGIGETTLRNLLKTTRLPEFVRKDLEAGEISLANAVALEKVKDVSPESEVYTKAKTETVSDFKAFLTDAAPAPVPASAKTTFDPNAPFVPKPKAPKAADVQAKYEALKADPYGSTVSALDVFNELFQMNAEGIAKQQADHDEKVAKFRKAEAEKVEKMKAQKAKLEEQLAALEGTDGAAEVPASL